MGRKSKTKLTFSLTIEIPSGVNIPTVRQFIRDALQTQQDNTGLLEGEALEKVKLHLTNKETSYA